MKNIFYAGLIGVALMTSCQTSNRASQGEGMISRAKNAQLSRAQFLKLKGTWELASVDHSKDFRVKPFDEGVDAQCFVGSQWTLIPNNYSGKYVLSGNENCPAVTQPIKIDFSNGYEFKFKKIAAGTKAKQNLAGYSLELMNQTENSFSLIQNVDGVRIVYNFVRIK